MESRSRERWASICDIRRPDGTPFEGDSRYILKRALREAAEDRGYTFQVDRNANFSCSIRRRRKAHHHQP